jgi:hypothetical protein
MRVFSLDCVHQLSDINDRIIIDGHTIITIRLTGETGFINLHYSYVIKRIESPWAQLWSEGLSRAKIMKAITGVGIDSSYRNNHGRHPCHINSIYFVLGTIRLQ